MPNGNSDVKLVHGQVRMEAWDLCVDSKDRRKNDTPHRRALVHDFNDGLTINWGEDYPGGVAIKGMVNMDNATINGEGRISDLIAHKVRMNGPLDILLNVKPGGNITRPPAGVSDQEFKATVGGWLSDLMQTVEQGITQEFNMKVDVVDAIATLTRMVITIQASVAKVAQLSKDLAELKAQVAAAQQGWRLCNKCQGLFFPDATPTKKRPCPAGGEHEGTGNYRLLK